MIPKSDELAVESGKLKKGAPRKHERERCVMSYEYLPNANVFASMRDNLNNTHGRDECSASVRVVQLERTHASLFSFVGCLVEY